MPHRQLFEGFPRWAQRHDDSAAGRATAGGSPAEVRDAMRRHADTLIRKTRVAWGLAAVEDKGSALPGAGTDRGTMPSGRAAGGGNVVNTSRWRRRMDTIVLAMQINQSAEAARRAGISVLPNAFSKGLRIHSPHGSFVLAGQKAKALIGEAQAIWGLAGVVSFQTALLYCASIYLAQLPGA